MITYLSFRNFRGFQLLELDDLKQITLLSGKNNVGKSSALEGAFLLLDHVNPQSFTKINAFRGNTVIPVSTSLWEVVFYQMDTKQPLEIKAVFDGEPSALRYLRDDSFVPSDPSILPDIMNQFVSAAKESYTLKYTFNKGKYQEEGHFVINQSSLFRNIKTTEKNNFIEPLPHTQFINHLIATSDADVVGWFGKMELAGNKQLVIDALKIIEPSIADISTIAINGVVQLYGKMGDQLMPLKLLGDGVNRLLYMVLSIIGNPNSIILIDEIETGFHYSLQEKLWDVIAKTALEFNCQIIATTHSYECIAGALEGIADAGAQNSFCYYRLDKEGAAHQANRFNHDLLATATASDMEVR